MERTVIVIEGVEYNIFDAGSLCDETQRYVMGQYAKKLERKLMCSEMKEEESKYYTPTIEEFCVGFEYEHMNFKTSPKWKWCKETFYLNQSHIDLVKYCEIDKTVRVKFLDKLDVENLGFQYQGLNSEGLPGFRLYFDDKMWSCTVCTAIFNKSDNTVNITIQSSMFYDNDKEGVTFKVKNKSELKRILESLNIL